MVGWLESASPSRCEGRRVLSRHLSQGLLDERRERDATRARVPLGLRKQIRVDRDRQLPFHRRWSVPVLRIRRSFSSIRVSGGKCVKLPPKVGRPLVSCADSGIGLPSVSVPPPPESLRVQRRVQGSREDSQEFFKQVSPEVRERAVHMVPEHREDHDTRRYSAARSLVRTPGLRPPWFPRAGCRWRPRWRGSPPGGPRARCCAGGSCRRNAPSSRLHPRSP